MNADDIEYLDLDLIISKSSDSSLMVNIKTFMRRIP